jgi:hypothetical protein
MKILKSDDFEIIDIVNLGEGATSFVFTVYLGTKLDNY